MSRSKSKKEKKAPQVDPRVFARPRLDELFARRVRGDLDDDGLLSAVKALMAEAGTPSVLDAFVKRMEGTPEGQREALLTLAAGLRNKEVISLMWQRVRKPRILSLEAKITALVILHDWGEPVDLNDPSQYFSARDLKPSDMQTAENLFRTSIRGMVRSLRESRDPVAVESFMVSVNRLPQGSPDGNGILLSMIVQAEQGAGDLEADFIYALAQTTTDAEVRTAAEKMLAQLSGHGIRQVAKAVLALGQDRLYRAYMTDPLHPWQQSVTVAWERGGGSVQALVFLLDFGFPWQGAMKVMFPTNGMTPAQFQRDFVDRSESKMGMHLYHVSLARAQATIAAAVEANRVHHRPLPKDFNEYRHLVERWVLHPSASALAADTTRDELSHLPLTPDRSKQPTLVDLRDLQSDEDDLPVDEFDIADFAAMRAEIARVHEAVQNPWWSQEWLVDHFARFSPHPKRLKTGDEQLAEIIEHWIWLRDFLEYLEVCAYEIHAAADVHGFHLSEYLEMDAAGEDLDDGRTRAEIVRDFFAFLKQGVPTTIDPKLLPDIDAILADPDEFTLLLRPEPFGGEVALWFPQFGESEHDEPFTYNEWWLALVLERKFKDHWERARREAPRKPDGKAKLALLDGLERRLDEDDEYLDDFPAVRPPAHEDYKRAERWFEREQVNLAKAW